MNIPQPLTITDGAGAAVAAGALANNDVAMLVDSVLAYTLGYWDMSEETTTLIEDSVRTDAITTVGGLLAQGLGLTKLGMHCYHMYWEKYKPTS